MIMINQGNIIMGSHLNNISKNYEIYKHQFLPCIPLLINTRYTILFNVNGKDSPPPPKKKQKKEHENMFSQDFEIMTKL